jgi:hypothetical protein
MQDDYKIIADVRAALDDITDLDREKLSELLVLQEWGDIHAQLKDVWTNNPKLIEPAK